jgi:hypothetical protein
MLYLFSLRLVCLDSVMPDVLMCFYLVSWLCVIYFLEPASNCAVGVQIRV